MIKIHFPFMDDTRPYLPIAAACCRKPLPQPFGITSAKRFESLKSVASQFFQSAPLDKADIVFYPHCYEERREVFQAAELARKRQIPCVFVKYGDDSSPTRPPYGVVLKESISASKRLPHEDVIPPFVAEPLGPSRELQMRSYTVRPAIGFCGYVGSLQMIPAYYLAGRKQKIEGLLLRRRAIRTLRKSPGIETKFVLRRQYWGGAKHLAERRLRVILSLARRKNATVEARWDTRREKEVYSEFVSNMINTDYTLCVRGAGNYSYRFYETLAAGRIPLFINTDCVLPFAERIPWQKHCVWVEADSLDHLGNRLVEFHESLDHSTFQDLQRANRQIYETYLSPVGFYRQALHDIMNRRI